MSLPGPEQSLTLDIYILQYYGFFFNLSLGEQTENIQRMMNSVTVIYLKERKKWTKNFKIFHLPGVPTPKIFLCFKALPGNQNISLSTFTSIKMHYRIHQKTILY